MCDHSHGSLWNVLPVIPFLELRLPLTAYQTFREIQRFSSSSFHQSHQKKASLDPLSFLLAGGRSYLASGKPGLINLVYLLLKT